ncbi:MAG: flagellar hook-associated protein FlgL [Planctomycetales bacterium]|nr:flagellar hook-associated protein FlgL [Planctomycetales bacterium]
MAIRVTAGAVAEQTIRYAQRHQSSLGRLQEQLISGQRLGRPSDDPLAFQSVLKHRSVTQMLDIQVTNIERTNVQLEASVANLQDAKNVLSQAHVVALGGHDPQDREVLAQSVRELLDSLLQIANRQIGDDYLYSGTTSRTQPFQKRLVDGQPVVDYLGGDRRSSVVVGESIEIDVLYSGADVFKMQRREESVYIGNTGAGPGTGTDSANGQTRIEVRHLLTTYAAGSGIQAGLSSVDGDTILGAAGTHQLEIEDTSGTGAAGVIRLNGGAPVHFSNTDTDLRVTGLQGEVLYVDTSAITPGFSGTVDITADGEFTIGDGGYPLAIDFSANQQYVDPVTGEVTNVSTAGVHSAGTDLIEYRGDLDLFQLLTDLANDLSQTRELAEPEYNKALDRRVKDLLLAMDHVLATVGEQSVTLENIQGLKARHEDLRLELETVIVDLSGTDAAEAILQLQTEQTLLNLTFASSTAFLDQTLLDFLR